MAGKCRPLPNRGYSGQASWSVAKCRIRFSQRPDRSAFRAHEVTAPVRSGSAELDRFRGGLSCVFWSSRLSNSSCRASLPIRLLLVCPRFRPCFLQTIGGPRPLPARFDRCDPLSGGLSAPRCCSCSVLPKGKAGLSPRPLMLSFDWRCFYQRMIACLMSSSAPGGMTHS